MKGEEMAKQRQVRHAHEDWRRVAHKLAQRVAALQEMGGYREHADEILRREYEVMCLDSRWGIDGEAFTPDELLKLEMWRPAKGAPLFYGELTTRHLENIIGYLEEKIMDGWCPDGRQDPRVTLKQMLRLLTLRGREIA